MMRGGCDTIAPKLTKCRSLVVPDQRHRGAPNGPINLLPQPRRLTRGQSVQVPNVDAAQQWAQFWSTRTTDIKVTLGVEFVDADDEFVEVAMDFKPEIGQVTGVYSAGALIQLADIAATWHCLRKAGALKDAAAPFPFSVQMSANLVGNTMSRVRARAKLVSQSKSMMVAETVVRSEDEARTVLLLTSTHMLRPSSRS